jgi:uncharacterized membrane protein YbhN (UPF0104 family)
LLKKFIQRHPRLTAAAKLLAKAGLTALALHIVFRHIDWTTTVALARQVPAPHWLAGLALYVVSKGVSAVRLHQILLAEGLPVPAAFNLRLYFQGMFYNLFLPGGVGGDGYKAIVLQQRTRQPLRKVIVALLLDRISGVVALVVLAALFFMMADVPVPPVYRAGVAVVLVLAIPAWLAFLYLFFRSSLPVFTPSLGLSLLVQVVQVLQAWVLLAGLQVTEGWLAYALVFLLSSLATLIPLTVGGLGARELVFVFAAGRLGISQEVAVTFSLLFFVINAVSSLPGIFIRTSPPKAG